MKAAKNLLQPMKLESSYFGVALRDMIPQKRREREIKSKKNKRKGKCESKGQRIRK
jgi:hypothetical protein